MRALTVPVQAVTAQSLRKVVATGKEYLAYRNSSYILA